MRKITILMIGLGRIGGKFYQQFKEMNPEQVQVIAISEPNMDNPLVADAEQRGITNFPAFEDAIDQFGEQIDIIMDTSNRPEIKQAIREKLQQTNNQHSVVVPMVVDYLMWYLLPGSEAIPQSHHTDIGY
ncbi:homoserine dehydrogenase [Thiomicrorhabdus sp. zzn3]|uniref:homoserine dehydrogenase n=1 Tax=Thiomicrorhabdus sp. zzn3 TaxID=3039775 RepID=UPI002436E016|nr:homoserine dehydrogenase [Thiomicrorhabdus sp. zzn3]MDG6777096.1 homoserine dehydrogenase [Thiomicrorhabdus sp. zzn3]